MSEEQSVFLLAGDDDLLLDRALEEMLGRLTGDRDDVDVVRVDVATAEHLPEMRTPSLFGGSRCVVVRDAAGLSGTLAEEVSAYLDDPAPDVQLVLVARGTGRIRSIASRVKEVGERVDVKAPAAWARREWEDLVRREFRRLERDVTPAAIAAILDRAGTDPGVIATRVAQVAAATAAASRIDTDDVARVVEGHGNPGAFAVADAVADRDAARAILALRGALEAGEAPLALLGAIAFRLRQLLQVRSGATPREASISAGQHKRLAGIARGFRPGELAWCHDRLARADLDLKGSELPAEIVIEVAVAELATSRDVAEPWAPRPSRTRGA